MEINQPIHQAANPLPGSDGSDEESLLEMLGLNRPSQRRRMNRSSSYESDLSSDTSTARANNGISQGSAAASNAAETSQISSTRPVNNATRTLGAFINENGSIRSANHESGLIGILQLARSHADGYVGSLGHGNKENWFKNNAGAIFRPDGPLGQFKTIRYQELLRRFNKAMTAARTLYNRHHSVDETGTNQEEVPRWATYCFQYFQAIDNQTRVNDRASEARRVRNQVVASLTGRQAPLGYQGRGPEPLRSETAPNAGGPELRQRIIGQVQAQSIPLVEGRDDTRRVRTAPPNIRNGPRRRNVHTEGFAAGVNDPSSRMAPLGACFHSMNELTQVNSRLIASMEHGPPRQAIDIVENFHTTLGYLNEAASQTNTIAASFFSRALNAYDAELRALMRTNGSENEAEAQHGEEDV
jgi:hypothetical protein